MAKIFPVSTSNGHGQELWSWQSSSLSPPLTVMGRAWVVAKLFPVSTSDGHGQELWSWQSSSLSPPLTVMGKGLDRGKALSCPGHDEGQTTNQEMTVYKGKLNMLLYSEGERAEQDPLPSPSPLPPPPLPCQDANHCQSRTVLGEKPWHAKQHSQMITR